MFEFIFSSQKVSKYKKLLKQEFNGKQKIVPVIWTEHCIECAAPTCYSSCPRFKSRNDGHCIRIVNGISPIIVDGQLGAKVEFRTWGKIECQYKIRSLSGKQYFHLYLFTTQAGYFFNFLSNIAPKTNYSKFINNGWFSYRQKLINFLVRNKTADSSLTLQAIVINKDVPTTLLIDIKSASKLLFRESVDIPLGETPFSIALPPYEEEKETLYLNIHPANAEQHVLLSFKQLDICPTDITQGKKIKCVVWDLDNTLWKGILVEDKNVQVNQQLVELIKHLDSCGIVNSIVSKNNIEQVEKKLIEFGISDYFVFKKVNWEPKSVNLAKTIKQMNINANTFVFVDDNPFERTEVSLRLPSVTCIDPSEMIEFSKCNRFEMIVTEDSKKRRATYRMLESLKTEEENWNGNIDDFLLSCHIKLTISKPTARNIIRCYELLQRTNQLNSSGRRLSLEEVKAIISSPYFDSFVLESSDKFGDYGIVGFLIVDKITQPYVITDFVISCRVANKRIEPSIINYLAAQYGGKIMFNYKKTSLNGPMHKVIEELKMSLLSDNNDLETFVHQYNSTYPKIVEIIRQS